MKQVININFHGRIIPIEQPAYDALNNYIQSLKAYFANEEGHEEIINDIESRISELFQQQLNSGANCITDADVENIKRSIGTPADFAGESATGAGATDPTGAGSRSKFEDMFSTNTNRRLYRNENDKVIGGVCSGLAAYFGWDPTIIRILFLVSLLGFGFGFLPYIILWVLVPSSATLNIGSVRKRLFRDMENAMLGGVCSGMALYTGVNVWIPRIIFLLPSIAIFFRNGFHNIHFGTNFSTFIIYIIAWGLIPEAKSTSEKLEMRGEKVDLESIKNSVMDEMKDVTGRTKTIAGNAMSQFRDTRHLSRFGDIIGTFAKIIAYIILGAIVVSLAAALFGMNIAGIGVFPLKDFILADGIANVYAWITLICLILIPTVALVVGIMRRVTKAPRRRNNIFTVASGLSVAVGLVSLFLLAREVSTYFRRSAGIEPQTVMLTSPTVNALEVRPTEETLLNGDDYGNFNPWTFLDQDTIPVNNVRVNLFKSPDSSFMVKKILLASGNTQDIARENASRINYDAVYQQDSILYASNEILIDRTNKFRNQRVYLNIYVPVGKHIKVGNFYGSRGTHFIIGRDNDYSRSEGIIRKWNKGVWYEMHEDGLYTLDGIKAGLEAPNDEDWDDRRNRRNRRRNTDEGEDIIENKVEKIQGKVQEKLDQQSTEQRIKDSLFLEKEKINLELERLKTTKTRFFQSPAMGTIFSPLIPQY